MGFKQQEMTPTTFGNTTQMLLLTLNPGSTSKLIIMNK